MKTPMLDDAAKIYGFKDWTDFVRSDYVTDMTVAAAAVVNLAIALNRMRDDVRTQ